MNIPLLSGVSLSEPHNDKLLVGVLLFAVLTQRCVLTCRQCVHTGVCMHLIVSLSPGVSG